MWIPKKAATPTELSKEQAAFLAQIEKRKKRILHIQILLLLLFFLLWEVAARLDWIDSFIFSQPSRMAKSAWEMMQSGILFHHVFTTLWETVVGFLLGTILGTVIAILLWWNPFLCDVLEPYLVVLNALPKTALAPIIIVWIGNNQKSIIAVALFTSVIVTIMNVLTGFLQIDKEKIKLIQVFGGTKMQALQKVVFPANIPCILNALKVNVGLSFVGVIVGEFLVAQAGLGFLIVYGSQVFKLDWVMLSVIVLAILAAGMYQSIALFEKFLLRKRHL